jgi:hypothetical protein
MASCQEHDSAQNNTLTNIKTTASSNDSQKHNGALITFEEDVHNFGTMVQGEQVSYSFPFINKGDEDLIISMARGSCGCTVPTYPKEPIKPGKGGKIDVVFDSENLIGINQKTITLLTNSRPNGIYTLTIQSSIILPEQNN